MTAAEESGGHAQAGIVFVGAGEKGELEEEIEVFPSKEDIYGNCAYIDNQNLYMATHRADEPWDVDMRRLRVYLREKYHVVYAYLFMGAFDYSRQSMYMRFQECGYILVFREHGMEMKGKKKGNVDVDVVFEMMRDMYNTARMEKAVLVSGDGDYFRTVEHLIANGKFCKILLPSHKNASSLYKVLPEAYKAYLDASQVRNKIGRRQ